MTGVQTCALPIFMVMNQGHIEEIGLAEDIYNSPQKPYTQQLIAAIPDAQLDDIRQRQGVASANTLSHYPKNLLCEGRGDVEVPTNRGFQGGKP